MLESKIITLKAISRENTDEIIKWRNSDDVKRNFVIRDNLTVETHMKWLKSIDEGKTVQFIIVEKEFNRNIGTVYLKEIDKTNHKAEFGIFIGEKSARGKGYGVIATQMLLLYAFNDLDLNKIFLRVLKENKNAIKCYEKAGFVEDGVFREDAFLDNEYKDVVFMSVLKSEFNPHLL